MRPRSSSLISALSTAPRSMVPDGFRALLCRHLHRTSFRQNTYKQHPTQRDPKTDLLLSRVSGPTDKPLCELSLGQFWEDIVAKYADRPALVSKHEPATQHGESGAGSDDCIRWSYGAMNEHVQSLVSGLHQLGVRKGDRVAVLMM